MTHIYFLPVQLFSEVLQCRGTLWGIVLKVDLYVTLIQITSKEEELTKICLPVFLIQVAVALQKVTKLYACSHSALHKFHEQLSMLY